MLSGHTISASPVSLALALLVLSATRGPNVLLAQESCAQDSSKGVLEHLLVEAVLLERTSNLTDVVDTVWLKGMQLPMDSGPAEVLNRWVGWWHTLIANCVAIPDELRSRFATHFNLATPPPDPYPQYDDNPWSADRIVRVDDQTVTADVGGRHGGCSYIFKLVNGRWEVRYPAIMTCTNAD